MPNILQTRTFMLEDCSLSFGSENYYPTRIELLISIQVYLKSNEAFYITGLNLKLMPLYQKKDAKRLKEKYKQPKALRRLYK